MFAKPSTGSAPSFGFGSNPAAGALFGSKMAAEPQKPAGVSGGFAAGPKPQGATFAAVAP